MWPQPALRGEVRAKELERVWSAWEEGAQDSPFVDAAATSLASPLAIVAAAALCKGIASTVLLP